ncbi:hypothetical protein C100_08320 [Sphingobium sp. C100]|nr:hypothetical protein C100_08320 [Sphingobium sp. C100]
MSSSNHFFCFNGFFQSEHEIFISLFLLFFKLFESF